MLCRSAPWRAVTRRVVLPWGLQGFRPDGRVLEIGAGSGAMAAQLLESFPSVQLTATDFDEAMVDSITRRLAPFGGRATTRQADATALPFPDDTFDAVVSWIMLHHTLQWEKALDEALRVVRPGGRVVGYDLLATPSLRGEGHSNHTRKIRLAELRDHVSTLPVDQTRIARGLGGIVVRFDLRKTAA